jgi:hypothetical protein
MIIIGKANLSVSIFHARFLHLKIPDLLIPLGTSWYKRVWPYVRLVSCGRVGYKPQIIYLNTRTS